MKARPRGQALVLAALVVLVLALAVLTTVNLGHAVHERVRLQNTADAAAYSTAAVEARAFNLYAFTNRAQVSHYVSAMVWQSNLSFLFFVEAFLVDGYGLAKTFLFCLPGGNLGKRALCELVKAEFPALQVLDAIAEVIRRVIGFYQEALRHLDVDRLIGRFVVPAHRTLNAVLTTAATATFEATLSSVSGVSRAVIAENDPNLDPEAARGDSGALVACLFDRAHMAEVRGNAFQPLTPRARADTDKRAHAKRAMGSVSNATRFGCDGAKGGATCRPGFVGDRRFGRGIPELPVLGPLLSLNLVKLATPKMGQTRLLSHQLARGAPLPGSPQVGSNFIRHWKDAPRAPMSMLAQGDNLGSDDFYWMVPISKRLAALMGCRADRPERCWGDPRQAPDDGEHLPYKAMLKTSIWALNDDERDLPGWRPGGLHHRVVRALQGKAYPEEGRYPRDDEDGIGLRRHTAAGVLDVWTANIEPVFDGNHPWPGIVPFPHFEPGQYAGACGEGGPASDSIAAAREEDFNQPSTWVLLRKNAAQLRNPRADPGAGRATPAQLNAQAALPIGKTGELLSLEDSRVGVDGSRGLQAIARGQVYYHRPGNWAEHPNFFNPYWRARLASVWQGRRSNPWVERLAQQLPSPLKEAPQRAFTH